MNFVNLLFNKPTLFNNKELNGMINSSRKINFMKGIGHSCLILERNISREVFAYDGWDLMK